MINSEPKKNFQDADISVIEIYLKKIMQKQNFLSILLKSKGIKIVFQLTIKGKERTRFESFLTKFKEIDANQKYTCWTIYPEFNTKEYVTVLKSPHINKTAQEQFGYRTYSKTVRVETFRPYRFLRIMKEIQGNSLPGITLKVTLVSSGGGFGKFGDFNLLDLLDPNSLKFKKLSLTNFTLSNLTCFFNKCSQKTIFSLCDQTVEQFEVYGKLCLYERYLYKR